MYKCLLTLVLLTLCFGIKAQTQMGFYYNHTSPIGKFAENTHNQMGGFLMNVLVKPFKNQRISVGGEFGVSMYANKDYSYTISDGDFKGQFVEVNQDDCFLNYALIARFNLLETHSLVSPYIESKLGGMTFFSTLTEGELCEVDYGSETEYHGTAFHAGVGLGFLIDLKDVILIDVNANYNRAGQSNYRHLPEQEDFSFRLDLDDNIYRSKTDHFNIRLGLMVQF